MKLMTRFAFFATVALLAIGTKSQAQEIQYVEDFALSKDRTEALKQLIPGTEDYYFYNCLHLQHTEQFDKVDKMLTVWIKRFRASAKIREIQNRQALFLYEENPQRALNLIRNRLSLNLNHQRELRGIKPNLPIALDPKIIARETLTATALARHKNLNGFEDSSFEWLINMNHNSTRRRHLLSRMQRPDYDQLVGLISTELKDRTAASFGSYTIHRHLMPEQLEALLKAKPDLLNQQGFVNAYLAHLHPASHIDWQHDRDAHLAYLQRLWKFVTRLGPVHNSLKTSVLYRRLEFDRARGVFDKDRFMTYVKLPRRASYVNPKYLVRPENRQYVANLAANYSQQTQLAPVGNDEPLVRSFFHHFFVKENSTKPYEAYISDTYLRRHFAEAKIVNGLGDPEQWSSMLSPSEFKALKDRIDLDFAHTNKKVFGTEEAVSLDLGVKNVKALIVKVFEINTKNYYRDYQRPVDTDVNLDGLVANRETTTDYKEAPLRRVVRNFKFPEITKPGVYVIDFIGNGKSSRVLVRKGRLQYVARTSTAGHVFTIMDDKNKHLNNASLWLAGREYKADKDGRIAVPFSNQPAQQPIILSDGEFSTLDYFAQEAENYRLTAGLHIDRESLLNQRRASVIVRPSLKVNGTPLTLSVLEDVRLTITSTDHDGVSATKEVKDFKLFEDKESVYEFQVPDRLQTISLTLSAKVNNLSKNTRVNLADSQTFQINSIARTEKTEDLHLLKVGAGNHFIELLGRTGEVLAERAVRITLKHRDFRDQVVVTLQTDDHGRIHLGKLVDIDRIKAVSPYQVQKTWALPKDSRTYSRTLHALANQVFEVPYLGAEKEVERDQVSLLEYRGGTYVNDAFDALTIQNGMLRIKGLAAGEYGLWLKRINKHIRIRVIDGEFRDGYLLGATRHLEVRDANALHIRSIETDKESLEIKLWNATPYSRVHVIATRFVPAFNSFGNLAKVRDPEPYLLTKPLATTRYVAGRNIGDEYRYILDRKYAHKYAGNMLKKPSVLLNPWAVRTTSTGTQNAKAGNEFAGSGSDRKANRGRDAAERKSGPGSATDFANLDFLSDTSLSLLNIRPNKEGIVRVALKELGNHQHIHVIAVDPQQTVYRSITRAESDQVEFKDLRLLRHLPLDQHFTQQKQITVVKGGGKFHLADITSSRFEAYDSLSKVFALYVALSGNQQLVEFGFLMNWPNMKFDEKKKMYSKYASHELNFFLHRKDRKFFDELIKPYLANKHHKTFMDDYLLGTDLSGYRQPWQYSRLNTVERILLAERVKGESKFTRQFVGDQLAMLPPNQDRMEFLYKSALGSNALDTDDPLGIDRAKEKVEADYAMLRQKGGQQGQNAAKGTTATASRRPSAPGESAAKKRRSSSRDLAGSDRDPQSAAAPIADLADEFADSRKADRGNFGPGSMGGGGGFGGGKYADGEKALATNGRFFKRDESRRKSVRAYYQKLDKTQEWAENNYYHLTIAAQNADLVSVNSFWNDYAKRDPKQAFFSENFTQSSRNFAEMMLALSVIELPFEAKKHKSDFKDGQMNLLAGSSMVIFHQEIREAELAEGQTPILVSQNFFRNNDRFRMVNGERVDKYVTHEFLTHTVYGCQVVVTNPTSSRQKLSVLLQVPKGAVPVLNSKYTRSVPMNLNPFSTQTMEYHFYFPATGEYPHYSVHVAKSEKLIAFAPAKQLKVVDTPSTIDKESWDYVSQDGTDDDVINYLQNQNLLPIRLDRIAFRMKDKNFFNRVVALLDNRHAYNHTLWSYGVSHNDPARVQEFLKHADSFVNQCGAAIESQLLTINPVERRTYQHLDYSPLVNARAHQLGKRRQILNDRLFKQYHALLRILTYRRQLDDEDLIAVTYYMVLQDRIGEAFDFFERIDTKNLSARIQYDYFSAYLDLFSNKPTRAQEIALRYRGYPVPRWQTAFGEIEAALQEIGLIVAQADLDTATAVAAIDDQSAVALVAQKVAGGEPPNPAATSDTNKIEERTNKQTDLAKTEPNFDFKVESKKIELNYQNLQTVTVKYYEMDIELLFSRNPFVQRFSGAFSYIKPNVVKEVKLGQKAKSISIDLPKVFHNSNVLVEITGAGQTKTQTYYSNSLDAQVVENYGHVRVTDKKAGRPLSKVYVKVYALLKNGQIKFFKDGYTDIRGRFDYTSLNTNELDFVQRFSLLVLSDTHGAVVREAVPPKR
jgi:hypothetical protein